MRDFLEASGPIAKLALFLLVAPVGSAPAQSGAPWWPVSGAVILEGGHVEDQTFDLVAKRLIALAGGPGALIVIIPTANEAVAPRIRGTGPAFDTELLKRELISRGAHHVAILHTRDRRIANSEEFAKLLRQAGGVWIPGGGARLLEQTYGGTLVERELRAVLARGGVLAGDSAGAIALGCYSLGWTPDPWGILITGFAALPHATVLPHASAAQGYVPWEETLRYLVAHPGPTGVVIDENTAIIMKGSDAEVVGAGSVVLVDAAKDKVKPFLVLRSGETRNVAR